ncbi:MAG: hypothetical protein EB006_03500 [Betaproteobacteria bacterium]|nr:hypothetical protein [Betaproteobacteria bacterium]
MSSISGGPVWHWRAWRRALPWQSTRDAINGYHQACGPKDGELLLLGCSAGWMLKRSWLKGKDRLRGRTWGSLHDRISGPVRITAEEYKIYSKKPWVEHSDRLRSNAELMQDLAQSKALKAHGEWLDHLTTKVFCSDHPRAYVLWPFATGYWHWLELAWVKPK